MPRNPFGWDLPPGCTNTDIDRHFGGGSEDEYRECKYCGDEFKPEREHQKICHQCEKELEVERDESVEETSPCCGVLFDEDIRICPKCKEHC